MNSLNQIEQQILIIFEKVKLPISTVGKLDTCYTLYDLASNAEWTKAQFDKVIFLSERLDISKKFFLGYHENGRKAVDTELKDKLWLELAVAILLKATLCNFDSPVEQNLKRFNVLFKALDLIQPTWLSSDSVLKKLMLSSWESVLQKLPVIPTDSSFKRNLISPTNIKPRFKTIPLTLLFYEGPIARAYLETIKSLGFKPQKIIELVIKKDIVTGKPLGKWLPVGMRKTYATSIHRSKIHHWPKQLLKLNSDIVTRVKIEVSEKLGFSVSSMINATKLLPLNTYSDNIVSLLIDNLADEKIQNYLLVENKIPVLFTGGGLVPASLLNIQQLKFLHIHPGFLPDIRGADCTLWSSLLSGHTSATCFYMSPGIDTGDIIQSCWLPKLNFGLNTKNIDIQNMYRIVYSFIDPWVRASVLHKILINNTNFDKLSSVPQDKKIGETFHFMHEKLKDISLNRLIH